MKQSCFNKIKNTEIINDFLNIPVHTHEDMYNIPGVNITHRRIMGMNGVYTPTSLVFKFRTITNGILGLEAISHFKKHLLNIGLGETASFNLSVTAYLLSKKFLEDELALYII